MTGSRGAPLVTNSDGGAGVWPPGFAFDFDITLPRDPHLPPGTSYAVARRDAFPPAANLGATFISSSDEGEEARRS